MYASGFKVYGMCNFAAIFCSFAMFTYHTLTLAAPISEDDTYSKHSIVNYIIYHEDDGCTAFTLFICDVGMNNLEKK